MKGGGGKNVFFFYPGKQHTRRFKVSTIPAGILSCAAAPSRGEPPTTGTEVYVRVRRIFGRLSRVLFCLPGRLPCDILFTELQTRNARVQNEIRAPTTCIGRGRPAFSDIVPPPALPPPIHGPRRDVIIFSTRYYISGNTIISKDSRLFIT